MRVFNYPSTIFNWPAHIFILKSPFLVNRFDGQMVCPCFAHVLMVTYPSNQKLQQLSTRPRFAHVIPCTPIKSHHIPMVFQCQPQIGSVLAADYHYLGGTP